jgi:oligopeptide/dipeptide ABC transporter ATP-binding protein
MPLLEVKNLSVEFMSGGRRLPAVTDVSFSLEKGGTLALVGESGCGKSVTCLSLAKLLPEPPAVYAGGEILFDDGCFKCDVLKLGKKGLLSVRGGRIAYIFQEPSVSLNPVFRVGDQIAEAIALHRPDVDDIEAEVVSQLAKVGIPEPRKRADCYPHEMSGGMQQRVMIAMALSMSPKLLIADEPTTALDVTIQAQILELLEKIREGSGMGIILITHNLGIVAGMADSVAVMYAGRIVETGPARELVKTPLHPYTRALLSAVPKLGKSGGKLFTIPGMVPSPADYPAGCRFFGRCALAQSRSAADQKRCAEQKPEFVSFDSGARRCACHFAAA